MSGVFTPIGWEDKVKKETGGPAFPVPIAGDSTGFVDGAECGAPTGINIRDYFAAKALPDLIAGYSRNQGSGPYLDASPDEIAYWAYRYADAMIAARVQ